MLAYILHRRDTFDDTYDLQGLVLSPFQSHEPNNRRKSRVLLDSKVDVGELQRLSEVSVLIVRSKMRTKLIEEAKGWLRGEKNEMAKRGKFDEYGGRGAGYTREPRHDGWRGLEEEGDEEKCRL